MNRAVKVAVIASLLLIVWVMSMSPAYAHPLEAETVELHASCAAVSVLMGTMLEGDGQKHLFGEAERHAALAAALVGKKLQAHITSSMVDELGGGYQSGAIAWETMMEAATQCIEF